MLLLIEKGKEGLLNDFPVDGEFFSCFFVEHGLSVGLDVLDDTLGLEGASREDLGEVVRFGKGVFFGSLVCELLRSQAKEHQ